jgi:hypothetical protein
MLVVVRYELVEVDVSMNGGTEVMFLIPARD